MLFTKYNSIGCPAISGHTMKTLAQSTKGKMSQSKRSDTEIFLSSGPDRPGSNQLYHPGQNQVLYNTMYNLYDL